MKRYRFSWNKPFITGLLFGALSLFYFSGSFGLRQVKRYQGIGAEFMPRIYAAVLFICAAIQLVEGIRRQFVETEPSAVQEPSKAVDKQGRRNVAFAFLLIFVYIAALKPVGFMLASAVFIFALCVLLTPDYAKRNYLGYAVFSVLLSAGTYFLFKNVLYIALPDGSVFGG